ncbi:hypothetical protein COCON_G00154940 [Conger conger]|uniref:C-X-C motif chemokine n=1 Tax=Conger conger TaxID=82655 RepID=A0A9Q1D8W7_CONCO|nr:alveolar macrophage chemotactic factor-like [Conger conger]KAJ8263037.1 hypothetical protein COCON_G00154940 [Conger conger]
MTPRPRFLFIALAVCFSALYVCPTEGFAGVNCRCLRTSGSSINPRQVKQLQIIPLGAQCRHIEILITLRNGWTVCLDPKAPSTQQLIEAVMENIKQKEKIQKERKTRDTTADAS